jgi:hypothetical protein
MVRQLRTFAVCWTISAFACVGCGLVQGPGKGTQKSASAVGSSKQTYTREEFTKLVTGKTDYSTQVRIDGGVCSMVSFF